MIVSRHDRKLPGCRNGIALEDRHEPKDSGGDSANSFQASVDPERGTWTPGNRLEVLSGNRKGQHSIRVNDQFRTCFVWRAGNAYDVEIVDYH